MNGNFRVLVTAQFSIARMRQKDQLGVLADEIQTLIHDSPVVRAMGLDDSEIEVAVAVVKAHVE